MVNRRDFIRTTSLTGAGLAMGLSAMGSFAPIGKRVGIIGLDTSHSIAFAKELKEATNNEFSGYKVVAAYPKGSLDIQSSVERIEGYTKEVQEFGVEIVDSIEALLPKVDVVLLETNDGRRHLEQVIPVLKAGKQVFVDKPIAASLAEAMTIFDAANHFNLPVFSASSLRHIKGMDKIKDGAVGRITGAEAFSPCPIDPSHPDFFWYGIHGVETLYTTLGVGCKTVVRISTEGTDFAVGTWEDGKIGSFRGIRDGARGYGGTVFGEKGIEYLGTYNGYTPLLKDIVHFFETGEVPVTEEETLEIFAFMEAADLSKKKGGVPVTIEEVMEKARKESKKLLKKYL